MQGVLTPRTPFWCSTSDSSSAGPWAWAPSTGPWSPGEAPAAQYHCSTLYSTSPAPLERSLRPYRAALPLHGGMRCHRVSELRWVRQIGLSCVTPQPTAPAPTAGPASSPASSLPCASRSVLLCTCWCWFPTSAWCWGRSPQASLSARAATLPPPPVLLLVLPPEGTAGHSQGTQVLHGLHPPANPTLPPPIPGPCRHAAATLAPAAVAVLPVLPAGAGPGHAGLPSHHHRHRDPHMGGQVCEPSDLCMQARPREECEACLQACAKFNWMKKPERSNKRWGQEWPCTHPAPWDS